MANLIVVCGPQAVGKMTVAAFEKPEEVKYLKELETQFTKAGGRLGN